MARKLTSEEIDWILDFLKPQMLIPRDSAKSVISNIKRRFVAQLECQVIHPEMIKELKEEIQKQYDMSCIHPGESVGPIGAQSFGQKTTQTTLDTFHKCGMSETTMVSGVPRFKEILDTSKVPNIVNHKIYFKERNSKVSELQKHVGHKISGVQFKDIILNNSIVIDKEDEKWYAPYFAIYGEHPFPNRNCVSLELDVEKMYEIDLNMEDIRDRICSLQSDLYCLFSPMCFGKFDVFYDTENISIPATEINPETGKRFAEYNRVPFNTRHTSIYELCLEETVLPLLESTYICGIPGIKEVFYCQDDDTKEWFSETNGFNSKSVDSLDCYKMLLSHPDVVMELVVSNNVWDIYKVLGIEAAREFLIRELSTIMDGINKCHTDLLVDRMTFNGDICAITRYTLRKDDGGPFGKASFEETMDNFLKAACKGEVEPTVGLSASLICGKKAEIGTGVPKLLTDFKKLMSLTPPPN